MERNQTIDITRGYAILLVVIGHSIQYAYLETMDENIIFRLIYSFHMSLFMFISGLAISYSKTEINLAWLRKRFHNLIIPFFAWAVIPFFFKRNWNEFFLSLNQLLISPDHGLWFLLVLFEISCMLFIICAVKKKFNLGGGNGIMPCYLCNCLSKCHISFYSYYGLASHSVALNIFPFRILHSFYK